MYNHNKAQQSKNRVHISWDILYIEVIPNHDKTLAHNGYTFLGVYSTQDAMM